MCAQPIYRIDVTSTQPLRSDMVQAELQTLRSNRDLQIALTDFIFLAGDLAAEELEEIGSLVAADPVVDSVAWRRLSASARVAQNPLEPIVEVSYRPGVPNPPAEQVLQAAMQQGVQDVTLAGSGTRYAFTGDELTDSELKEIAEKLLVNDHILHYALGEIEFVFKPESAPSPGPERIPANRLTAAYLAAYDGELRFAAEEIDAVREWFESVGRSPTRDELETIRVFWDSGRSKAVLESEIRVIGRSRISSVIREYFQSASRKMNASWVRSAFKGPGGVIEFDYDYDLSFFVHHGTDAAGSSPGAGAVTAAGEAIRSTLSIRHRPLAMTDTLLVGLADDEGLRRRTACAIGDLLNAAGLPAVAGAVLSDDGYAAFPAAVVGCVGLGTRSSRLHLPEAGDHILVLGAQQQAAAGHADVVANPKKLRKLTDVILRAKRARLVSALESCAEGGILAAIGNLAGQNGAVIDLDAMSFETGSRSPVQFLAMNSSDQLVAAVPPGSLEAFLDICRIFDLETVTIGEFSGAGANGLRIFLGGDCLVDLPLDVLQNRPVRRYTADLPFPKSGPLSPLVDDRLRPDAADFPGLLLRLMAHPNIAAKTDVIRAFDIEAGGISLIRPLVGKFQDGPSDAAVLKLHETAGRSGVVLAGGAQIRVGEVDAYAMGLLSVDEAVRNAVAVGANPGRIALVETLYGCPPEAPEGLGRLVEAARGSSDSALQLGTPFLNVFSMVPDPGSTGPGAVPCSTIVSAIGIHPNAYGAISMDLKSTGSHMYLVGDWTPFVGGSHVLDLMPDSSLARFFPPPRRLSEKTAAVYSALHQAVMSEMVCSAHDLSEGGLAVAAAEMSIAGRLGMELDLTSLHEAPFIALFAESPGCMLVEVATMYCDRFEMLFAKLPFRRVGIVDVPGSLSITHDGKQILEISVTDLAEAFSGRGGEADA